MIYEDLKKTQQRLKDAGYYDGKIDGDYGPKTDSAVNAVLDKYLDESDEEEKDPFEIRAYDYTRDANYGEKSEVVMQLQAMLVMQGFDKYLGAYGIDGVFGSGTRKGVEEYVRGRGLNAPAVEITKYKTITKEIWEMFYLKPFDIAGSIWTDEYMKCNCNGKYCDGHPAAYGSSVGVKLLVLRLQDEIREIYGENAVIRATDDLGYNGCARCDKWNAEHGGAPESQHEKETAIDIYVSGVSGVDYKLVQQTACTVNPYGGCSESYDSVCHIDTRGYKARW